MKNMKKGISTIVLMMTLAFVLALSGCGTDGGNIENTGDTGNTGSADTAGSTDSNIETGADGAGEQQKIYAGFYSLDPPEGYELSADNKENSWDKGDRNIQVSLYNSPAESKIESVLSIFDTYTRGEDVTFGDNTWKVVNFSFNNVPSVRCYLDLSDGTCVEVCGLEVALDDEAFQQVLNTITFQDNAGEKYTEFCGN